MRRERFSRISPHHFYYPCKPSTYHVNRNHLLSVDDKLCWRQLLFINRREDCRRETARGSVAIESCNDRWRQVRQLACSYHCARRDAEEFDVKTVALLHLINRIDKLVQILRN